MRASSTLVGMVAIAFTCGTVGTAKADESSGLGDTAWGLPGMARVGSAAPDDRRLSIALTGGYGYTQDQGALPALGMDVQDTGAHHRVLGTLAIGVRATDWLGLALRLDGRYDRHGDDMVVDSDGKELGHDDGWVGDPRFGLRAGFEVANGFSLGAELGLWFPGRDAPSLELSATSLDALALATFAPAGSGFTLATQVGFRLDNSGKSVDEPERLRRGDQIALGVSDSNAVLVGLGASYRTGATEILADVAWDILIGSAAPSVGKSPLHITAGTRYHVSDRIGLELLASIVPTGRPEVDPQALAPIEPLVTVMLGLRYRLSFEPTSDTKEEVPEDVEEAEPEGRTLRGQVVDAQRRPIEGATVRLEVGEQPPRERPTDSGGVYTFDKVPMEAGRMVIRAEGYEDIVVELGADALAPGETELARSTPMGELRGLVRSFAGEPIEATVQVGEQSAETDEEGRFQVELEQGQYEVEIDASGYQSQTRNVQIEENGVTVLNVELRRR